MSLKHRVKNYLESEPLYRERKNKDRGAVNILIERHQSLRNALEQRIVTKDDIVAILQEYNTLDRHWRLILKEILRLRGSDYDEKDELEAKAITALGYRTPRYVGEGEALQEDNQPTLL